MTQSSHWLNPLEVTHKARKRFGQNFLHDRYIIEQIVSAIAPESDQNLLEIGPGLGALTESVAKKVDQLTVIELDRDLAKGLESNPLLKNKIKIYQQDALKTDYVELAKEMPFKEKRLRVFGNLPYNISTPLMFHLFSYAHLIEDMYFMLQKEVVQRLAAGPGHKNYGRLSVMAHYYCEIIPVLEVPPESFRPAPKVDSAVVCLKPYQTLPHQATSLKQLERVCLQAFNMRRKTLRNSLRELFSETDFEQLEIRSDLRAENLSVADYVRLANFLESKESESTEQEC